MGVVAAPAGRTSTSVRLGVNPEGAAAIHTGAARLQDAWI
jgi:hypothetical protein